MKTISTGMDADEGTHEWYRRMYRDCQIIPETLGSVSWACRLCLKYKPRYQAVTKDTGVEWWVIALVHMKEASFRFDGILHNGERIIGTGEKTRLVPEGRGPFSTWEEAAIDAIDYKLSKLKGVDDITEILYRLERYNGTGYITGAGKSETSPYLWACTNVNDGAGKYASDGKFDPHAVTLKSVGVCAVLKLLERNGHANINYGGNSGPIEEPIEEPTKEPIMIYPKVGDKNDRVKSVQRALNAQGHSVAVDGDFGPNTLDAIKTLQLNSGLKGSGIIGPKTWAILFPEIDSEGAVEKILTANPGINHQMVKLAMKHFEENPDIRKKDVVTMVDFTKHSAQPRLYQIDMSSFAAMSYLVSHGKFSDKDNDGFVDEVSNDPKSHMSSHGAAVTHKIDVNPRYGQHLQLRGLEVGVNDNILERGLVVHSGKYVSDVFVGRYGKIGRTLGSWALDPKDYPKVVEAAGIGSLWYSYFDGVDQLPVMDLGGEENNEEVHTDDETLDIIPEGSAPDNLPTTEEPVNMEPIDLNDEPQLNPFPSGNPNNQDGEGSLDGPGDGVSSDEIISDTIEVADENDLV